MAGQNAPLLLQQVHGHGQQPPRDVRQTEPELVHVRLERLFGARHGDDARGSGVVDAVVHFVHAAAVDDVLSGDGGAPHRGDHRPELFQGAVILRAAEEAHLAVGHVVRRQRRRRFRAVGVDESAAADVLVRERLAENPGGGGHRASQQLGDLLQEVLVKRAPLLLELVRVQVAELGVRLPELHGGGAVLALERRDDGGHVLQVPLLQEALQEVAQLRDAHARALGGRQTSVAPALQLRRVALFLSQHGFAVVLV